VAGALLAAVGVYVCLQTPCGAGYAVAVQPVDEDSDPSEATVASANLTDHQRRAFDDWLIEDGGAFGPRESFERLDGTVVVRAGERHVTDV